MANLKQRYQQWLADFTDTLQQAEQQQFNNMVHFVEQLKAYIKAGRDLTAYETQLFVETLKRQWQEQQSSDDKELASSDVPPLWPEALWQELSYITDKSQIEWQELQQDFAHNGIYQQGEEVAMARYRCINCLTHVDYTHPTQLLSCQQCGGKAFYREGLPV